MQNFQLLRNEYFNKVLRHGKTWYAIFQLDINTISNLQVTIGPKFHKNNEQYFSQVEYKDSVGRA